MTQLKALDSFQDEVVMLTAIALYEFQEATGCDTAAQFIAQQFVSNDGGDLVKVEKE